MYLTPSLVTGVCVCVWTVDDRAAVDTATSGEGTAGESESIGAGREETEPAGEPCWTAEERQVSMSAVMLWGTESRDACQL